MMPVMLDLNRLGVALVGNGPLTLRRLEQLDEAGAARLTVFADAPVPGLRDRAGARLVCRLPVAPDLDGIQIVYAADLDPARAEALAVLARSLGKLVNVEDVVPLCDFHTPSLVRRGDLVIAVSTAGRSPTLARRLRRILEGLFPAVWAGRLDEVAAARTRWRAEGLDPQDVAARTEALIDERRWIPDIVAPEDAVSGTVSPTQPDQRAATRVPV